MVLIGETGSGKSTQLVQFLADSGVATSESVICTQPRKLAALALTQRGRGGKPGMLSGFFCNMSPFTFFCSAA